ncbi:hypothetical protein AFLA_012927 [Aspergillus flavus NRRL3357]|nr:uncharacterized protein G4B84_011179 [Aspergillus flavus NRRL3357]KAF7626985.1 hypothetical protein AFLA_012927 [Aspergillus flavus NRRL3357]QMW35688.1 hypothetical protein G4B84_011179 [Aspergillus flavus NRRL3357]QMW47750.1 hypothetical protein G4B11_011229 [Aspergillus flavus]
MASKNNHFVLPDSTPRSSKLTINIAGFHVHLYGVQELSAQQREDTTVLFHIHGRTRTYKDAEPVAHQLLYGMRKRGDSNRGLVVATFDNRNHGDRTIDSVAIQDWKGGNIQHAQDMLSTIDGTTDDIKLVMKYLASYVDGIFHPTQFIVTGVSLGGHITWNMLAEEPSIAGAIIIVGSPNLTDMLVERLGYASLSDIPQNTKEWPRSIESLYRERDQALEKIVGKKILILNGALDTLVPSKFTDPWVAKYAHQNDVKFIVQEDCGHVLSFRMMEEVVEWVAQILV